MPLTSTPTPFPPIDADPHFRRVVSYMRPSDYMYWAGATAAFPSTIYMMEQFDSTRASKLALRSAMRLSLALGAAGGFLFAYQRSSLRFWGWRENEVEQARASSEDPSNIPGFGESDLSPYMQGVAHRNSAFSQLKFSTIPWFNLVNHPHHEIRGGGLGEAKEEE